MVAFKAWVDTHSNFTCLTLPLSLFPFPCCSITADFAVRTATSRFWEVASGESEWNVCKHQEEVGNVEQVLDELPP